MSVMAISYEDIPVRDGGFTVADVDEMPDDGRRYELVDGVLVVSPTPRWEHQDASATLTYLLKGTCPNQLRVLLPVDVRRGERTSVQPDLCVVRTEDLVAGVPFAAVPVLAIEILSPSSIGIDKLLKREVYARLGVRHYWIVDVDEPSVHSLELDGDTYRELSVVRGDDQFQVDEPFSISFRPGDLSPRRSQPT